MLEAITYKTDGMDIKEISLLNDIPKTKKIIWIRAVNPDKKEVDIIINKLGWEKEDSEEVFDFLAEGDRPRLTKEDYIEIIYSVPHYEDGDTTTEPIVIYLKDNFLITIERKRLKVCEQIYKAAKRNKMKFLFKKNNVLFLSELIDHINDQFLANVNTISSRTDLIASKNKKMTTSQIEAISSASTTLAFFNQAIMANIEVLNGLKKLYHKLFKKDDREIFNDIYFDALQILDAEKVQREVIMNIFSLQNIISNNHLNEFMKKLTSLALIIMIPTLITGIYGMNINGLPVSDNTWSFPIVMGFMTVITVIIFLIFKKIDWV
ncbi:MAG: magnesium transporter CorA family protein [Candidatus Woesearchaeota archaeon]